MAAAGESKEKGMLCKKKNTLLSLWFRRGCGITGGEEDELSPRGLS